MIARTTDNREIFYRVTGTGPAIMFVHGAWPEHFNLLVGELSPEYQCITLDRLGFRRSSSLAQNTTIAEQISALEAVQNSITSDPVWMFGHSSGGNFALAYTLLRPDRVKGLVLVEPALYGIYPTEPPEVLRLQNEAIPLIKQGQQKKGWQAFLNTLFGPQVRQWNETAEDLAIIRAFGYDQPIVFEWYPSQTVLEQVAQPILILEGDKSPQVLRNICPTLHNQLPTSRLITLTGQNHLMPSGAPKIVAQVMTEFISQNES